MCLTSNNPSDRSPGAGKEEDVDADEGDHRPLGWKIVDRGDSASDGNDELTHGHTDGTDEKQIATAHLVNRDKTRQSRHNIDRIRYYSDYEGIREARILEI